jgi:transcriptional regulator with GAF, ATPase, and Fis domain
MDELTHNQRLLLALSQGAKSIQRSKSPEEIYKAIGEEMKKLRLETTVFALNEDLMTLSTVYVSIQPRIIQAAEKLTGLSANGYSFSIETGNFFDQIIKSKEAVFSLYDTAPFTSSLPTIVRNLAKPLFNLLNFSQSIIAPLIVEDKVYGLLSISGANLKESDLPAVTTFASQAAIAMENSLLVMRVIADSNEMEKRVSERTKELNTVIELMTGREIRMAGLKKAIKILRSQLEEAGLTPAANDPLLEGDIEGF